MTACVTCGGFGSRHDPIQHGWEAGNDEPCMCGTPFTCLADEHPGFGNDSPRPSPRRPGGDSMTAPELNHMEWDHPHLGRISETVCQRHESEVLRALTTLGIGCGGWRETDRTATCRRCRETVPPRVWLREGGAA